LDAGPDVYIQTKKSIEKISDALAKLGGALSDVVRTRVFVKSNVNWQEVAKAHREAFGNVRPASTMIAVEFLDPAVSVEIEADAVLDE
jgi:enamine deaminase RidA (YjgF/YER057c/UK114 family)